MQLYHFELTTEFKVRLFNPSTFRAFQCFFFFLIFYFSRVFLRVLRFSPLHMNQHFKVPLKSGIREPQVFQRKTVACNPCKTSRFIFLYLILTAFMFRSFKNSSICKYNFTTNFAGHTPRFFQPRLKTRKCINCFNWEIFRFYFRMFTKTSTLSRSSFAGLPTGILFLEVTVLAILLWCQNIEGKDI